MSFCVSVMSPRRTAQRALCGIKDCTCSGTLGTRGPQDVKIVRGYNDGTESFRIE